MQFLKIQLYYYIDIVVDTYVYTCDEQSRIVTEEITYGITDYVSESRTDGKPTYASRTVTHTYGDYYFYTPVA